MPVTFYELDREVFKRLQEGADSLDEWKGAASEIADYVGSWGILRFWGMSRSHKSKGGEVRSETENNEGAGRKKKRYFAWSVARDVLCVIVGSELNFNEDDCTQSFQNKFEELSFNQQILLTDLLIEIADSIQFWTMRLDDQKKHRNKR